MTSNHEALYRFAEELNRRYGLEIELSTVEAIYGNHVLSLLAEDTDSFEQKIEGLLERGFGDTVSDIVNRFGILLAEDTELFFSRLDPLLAHLGASYAEQISEDLSLLETLL